MDEETQNSAQDPTAQDETPKAPAQSAGDRLLREIASGTSIEKPVANPGGVDSEEKFMDFVAEKSQELPDKRVSSIPEEKKLTEEEKKHSETIRTYQTDVAETIRNKKLSLANIAVAEKTRSAIRTAPVITKEQKPSTNWKRIVLNILSAILLSAGVSALAFLYLEYQGRTVADSSVPLNTLALSNSNTKLDVTDATRESFLESLDEIARTTTGSMGDVVNISLASASTTGPVTARELLAILDADSDPAFLRSLQAPFMLGIHISGKPHYFLILKTTFFENAFSGMFRWEKNIEKELPFLVRSIPEETTIPFATSTDPSATSTDPSATSTATTTKENLAPEPLEEMNVFLDMVIQNKDVRARYGKDGEIDMLYTFTDPKTLIITTNKDTLKAILNRLTIARFKQ